MLDAFSLSSSADFAIATLRRAAGLTTPLQYTSVHDKELIGGTNSSMPLEVQAT